MDMVALVVLNRSASGRKAPLNGTEGSVMCLVSGKIVELKRLGGIVVKSSLFCGFQRLVRERITSVMRAPPVGIPGPHSKAPTGIEPFIAIISPAALNALRPPALGGAEIVRLPLPLPADFWLP